MKKVLACVCTLALALALTACQDKAAVSSGEESVPASSAVSSPASLAVSQPESTAPDSAAVDYTQYTFRFDVPEGFTEQDGSEQGVDLLYVSGDGSSINVVALENDGSLANELTEEAIVSVLENTYTQQLGFDATLENVQFSTGTIGGCPCYEVSFSVNLDGVGLDQTLIGVNGDMAYTFTFTDTTGGDWAEAFRQSILSIEAVPVA